MMSVVHTRAILQLFAEKLVADLEFWSKVGDGETSGEQIARCAADILRIDLRSRDPQGTINGFPLDLRNLLEDARTNPGTSFVLSRHIKMVKGFSGVSG